MNGESRPLQVAVQDELYSVGREAMTNAVRHSQGTQVVLELDYTAQYLALRCTDNGQGLGADKLRVAQQQGHWGIIGMQERARTLGCKLEFRTPAGSGTEVAIRVPAKKAYAASKLSGLLQTAARSRPAEFKPDNV